MIEVLTTLPISKMRDSLPAVLQIVDEQKNGVVLTHHGEAKMIAFSVSRYNELVSLFNRYEDLVVLQQRSREMDDGYFHTVEEAEAIFEEAGLMS